MRLCVGDTYAPDGKPSRLQTPALFLDLHGHEFLAARPEARPARAFVRRREHRHRAHFEVALARTHVLQVPQPVRGRLARARVPVDPDDDKQEHQALRVPGVSIGFLGEGEGHGLKGTEGELTMTGGKRLWQIGKPMSGLRKEVMPNEMDATE